MSSWPERKPLGERGPFLSRGIVTDPGILKGAQGACVMMKLQVATTGAVMMVSAALHGQ